MSLEKAKITFEHSDGRVITVHVENKGEGETAITSDFGENGPEEHANGLHANMYLSMMWYIEGKRKKSNQET